MMLLYLPSTHFCGRFFNRVLLLGLVFLPIAELTAQTTFETEKTKITVTLPGADPLEIFTNAPGNSPNGWTASTLENDETLPNGEQKFVTTFPEGGVWTLNRLTKTEGNVFTVADKWIVNKPIDGLVMTMLAIPYDKLDGITISNGNGEVSGSELSGITESQSFLTSDPVEEFSIKNFAGNSLKISFSAPGKFEVLSLPDSKKVEIRYFWPFPNDSIEEGQLTWNIEANLKAK